MYRITVRFARSSDRLFLVIVSDCFFAVHRIFVATVFASINGIAVFRAVYEMLFGFIRVSRSGNVTIRIFVSALFAIMNGIPSVRTGRSDHDFVKPMPVRLGVVVRIGIAAKVAGIFRIPFFVASTRYRFFRVFVFAFDSGFFAFIGKRRRSARADKRSHTRRQHYRRHDKF